MFLFEVPRIYKALNSFRNPVALAELVKSNIFAANGWDFFSLPLKTVFYVFELSLLRGWLKLI